MLAATTVSVVMSVENGIKTKYLLWKDQWNETILKDSLWLVAIVNVDNHIAICVRVKYGVKLPASIEIDCYQKFIGWKNFT